MLWCVRLIGLWWGLIRIRFLGILWWCVRVVMIMWGWLMRSGGARILCVLWMRGFAGV